MHVKQLMARSHTTQNVYKSTNAATSSSAMNGGLIEMKTSNGGDGAFDDENLLDSEGITHLSASSYVSNLSHI